jgi:hypothetical protein
VKHSRLEFRKKFQAHIAGLALFGAASEVKDSTLHRGARAMEIPGEVIALLDAMYDYLESERTSEQAANGIGGPGRGRDDNARPAGKEGTAANRPVPQAGKQA